MYFSLFLSLKPSIYLISWEEIDYEERCLIVALVMFSALACVPGLEVRLGLVELKVVDSVMEEVEQSRVGKLVSEERGQV